jgi:hypothetical protein
MIEEQTYELKLLKKWINYFLFHVSLLKSYRRKLGENPASYSEIVFLDKNEEWYKIKRILDDRWRREKTKYLMRWASYTLIYN